MDEKTVSKLLIEIQDFDESLSESDRILFFLNQFAKKVKSVCKRNDFPEELEYMAIEYAINNVNYENKKMRIASMSDEGQTVTFDNSAEIKKEDIDLNMYINKNMSEIAQYAYMGW